VRDDGPVEPTQLLGRWRLDRRVADRCAGLCGQMTGQLELVPCADGVRWAERGVFSYAGRRFDSTRDYLIRRRGDGWVVCFADGREFHPWRPGAVVEHPCRADLYRGLIDARPGLLRVLWDVRGPGKDQRLVTRCVPA